MHVKGICSLNAISTIVAKRPRLKLPNLLSLQELMSHAESAIVNEMGIKHVANTNSRCDWILTDVRNSTLCCGSQTIRSVTERYVAIREKIDGFPPG